MNLTFFDRPEGRFDLEVSRGRIIDGFAALLNSSQGAMVVAKKSCTLW